MIRKVIKNDINPEGGRLLNKTSVRQYTFRPARKTIFSFKRMANNISLRNLTMMQHSLRI
jgi:hypothetical protein